MTTQSADSRPTYHGVKMLAIIFSSMCLLTVAMTLGLGHLYMMAVAIAAIPLLSYAIGKQMLHGLSAQRTLPEVAWDGQPVKVQLTVHNASRMPKYFLQAKDTLPTGVQFYQGDGVIPLAVPAQGTQQTEYTVVFPRRGRYRLGPLSLQATDPLGLFFFAHRLREQDEVVVLPTPLSLPPLREASGAQYTTAGVHSAPVRGDSVEFLGIREYVPGDPLRRVDWKHSARYGQLFVRDFERFTQTEVLVLLDCSPPMQHAPNAFELMVKGASGVLHLAYQSGLPFRLLTGVLETDSAPAAWGMESLYRLLYALAEVAPRANVPWEQTFAKAVAEAPPGALLAFITARSDESVLPLLSTCTRKQVQVVALLPTTSATDPLDADTLYASRFVQQLYSLHVSVIPISPEVLDG